MQVFREIHNIKGILFDMDGVVLDTEKLYTRFWEEAGVMCGYPMTREHALGMRSLSSEFGIRKIKSYFGEDADYAKIRDKRIELMNAYIRENGVELKPGIKELLEYLHENGYKTAIATSSPLDRTKEYLTQVGLVDEFDDLISGHMVKKGKPEPDIYLYAASRLGLRPQECMVLEDSPTGIKAAFAAGCIPVMVPDQDEPDEATIELLHGVADGLSDVIMLLSDLN